MESIADIIIQAIPWLEGAIDVAIVSISALPRLVIGLPIWLYGVIGGGFLTWSWRVLS